MAIFARFSEGVQFSMTDPHQDETEGNGQLPATRTTSETIAEEFKGVIGPHISEDQRRQVASRIAMKVERTDYAPDPALLQEYEKFYPGSAKILIEQHIEGIAHQRTLENRDADRRDELVKTVREVNQFEREGEKEGRRYGLGTIVFVLSFALLVMELGHRDFGFVIMGVGAISAIVIAIIRGRRGEQISDSAGSPANRDDDG
ncbi:MAG: hypothetical protein JJU21_07395 [Salinarimonas sp.]|nr:hypothetical protein [Salinarimonas sp.]